MKPGATSNPDDYFIAAGNAGEPPFRVRLSRRVFCPPEATSPLSALARRVHSRLAAREPILSLLNCPNSAPNGVFDSATAYYPNCPAVHLKALCSASAVISFRVAPALAALANGVRAVLLGSEELLAELPDTFPVPCFAIRPDTKAEAICLMVEEELHRTIATAAPREIPSSLYRKRSKVERALRVCCMANEAYLPFFIGLLENLRDVHPHSLEIHLLCLDEAVRLIVERLNTGVKIQFHRLEDLWSPAELEVLRPRAVAAQAYSSKPRLLKRVLDLDPGPAFYFDLDLYFYVSPIDLIDELAGDSVLLFPQFDTSPLEAARNWGMFQAGMLLVKDGSQDLLDWWALACLQRCDDVFLPGGYFFADQGYLDLTPVLFSGVKIYWRGDQDVGIWSSPTVGATSEPERPWLFRNVAGSPVLSTHTTQVDESGLHELKVGWDQIASFFSLGFPSQGPLLKLILAHQSRFEPRLNAVFEWNSRVSARRLLKRLAVPLSTKSFGRVLRTPLGNLIATAINLHKSFRDAPLPTASDLDRRYLALVRDRIVRETPAKPPRP